MFWPTGSIIGYKQKMRVLKVCKLKESVANWYWFLLPWLFKFKCDREKVDEEKICGFASGIPIYINLLLTERELNLNFPGAKKNTQNGPFPW